MYECLTVLTRHFIPIAQSHSGVNAECHDIVRARVKYSFLLPAARRSSFVVASCCMCCVLRSVNKNKKNLSLPVAEEPLTEHFITHMLKPSKDRSLYLLYPGVCLLCVQKTD